MVWNHNQIPIQAVSEERTAKSHITMNVGGRRGERVSWWSVCRLSYSYDTEAWFLPASSRSTGGRVCPSVPIWLNLWNRPFRGQRTIALGGFEATEFKYEARCDL